MGLCARPRQHLGAQGAGKTDWSPLKGKKVVIVPDHDKAGAQYAREVARALTKLNPPASVMILDLPGQAEGEDIEQWIDRQSGGFAGARVAFDELVRRFAEPPEVAGRRSELARAVTFLAEQVVDGPVPSTVVEDRARLGGFSKRTLARAKTRAGVESRRLPGRCGWWYCRFDYDPSNT